VELYQIRYNKIKYIWINKLTSKYFIGILLVFSIYWLSKLYEPFLLTILIATLFSIATSSLYNLFVFISRSETLGAFFSATLLALIFFAPIGYFIYEGLIFVKSIDISKIELIIPSVKDLMSLLPEYLNFAKKDIEEFLISLNLPQLARDSVKYLLKIAGDSVIFFKDSILIIVFYFFIQAYRNKLARYFKRIIPLPVQDTVSLFREISVVMGTVFYSILFSAALQGGLFSIIVAQYDYNPIFFGILYGFVSLIPVIGGILMWLPLALNEFLHHNVTNGIIIILYSIIVIAFLADTIIKPIVIKYINTKIMDSKIQVNELLIFFAMISGMASFGFWGIILGPAIITFFLSLIKLYEKLYQINREKISELSTFHQFSNY
jgi:predicted PurR-regulated permease PerM